MKKKILVPALTAAIAAGVATVLFIPHYVTVEERTEREIPQAGMHTAFIKTNLFESLTHPKTWTPTKKANVTVTGMLDENGKMVDGKLTNIWKDRTLYVDYKPTTYTATYLVDGKEYQVIPFVYKETPRKPDEKVLAKSRPYEDFKGWKEKKSDDENRTYDAKFVGKTYKIAYNLDGGSVINPTTYQYGKGVKSFANATRDGYTFDGWYLDAAKTKRVKSVSKTTHGNLTLYAKFHENPRPVIESQPATSYSYSYRSYGGSRSYSQPAAAPVQQVSQVQQAAPAAAPAASGFPYMDNMGGVRIGSYEVGLRAGGGQATVDAPNTAFFEYLWHGSAGTTWPDQYRFADHAYQGTQAALLSGAPLQWKKPDGSVVTLSQKRRVIVGGEDWHDANGTYWGDPEVIANAGATIVFQTCYGSGELLALY